MSFVLSKTLDKYLNRGGVILDCCRDKGIPAFAGTLMLAAGVAHANDNGSTPMTAGVVVEKMEPNEFFHYVAGIIEGLAYTRFISDSRVAGHKDESGMNCMQDWYLNNRGVFLKIDATFRKYADYPPTVILAAMLKKECGE